MHDPVALVSLHVAPVPDDRSATSAASTALTQRTSPKPSWALYAFGATALVAVGFLSAGLPALMVCLIALSGISSIALGSALSSGELRGPMRPPAVAPEAIVSCEVQASYRAILLAFAEVETALDGAPRLRSSMAAVLERCRAAVELTGRIALLANPLQRYLDIHDPGFIRSSLHRLRMRAEAASDDAAAGAWSHAVSARMRQLAILEQLIAKRDQICARLALVHAAFESFAAAIVKLHTLDEELLVLAGESVTDQLAEIGADLDVLEAALEPELAA
jgi:hypothetical protein